MLAGVRCPSARWDPVSAAAVPWTTVSRRVVHHKTQSDGRDATATLYPGGGGTAPHFTVDEWEIRQHFDTNAGSRALENLKGGVETNSYGAIQIEIVGYSGITMPGATADNLIHLLKWIEQAHGVQWVWPLGRPDPAAYNAKGEPIDPGNHARPTGPWLNDSGHFPHSGIAEQSHWDPAYTDLEWFVLNNAMAPAATQTVLAASSGPSFKEYLNVNVRSHIVTMTLGDDGKGWSLTKDQVINPFTVREQGRYSAIGDPHVYDGDVLAWRSFVQNGQVEIVVDVGTAEATVSFEVLEFVPA